MAIDPQHTLDALHQIETGLAQFADAAERMTVAVDQEVQRVRDDLKEIQLELTRELLQATVRLQQCQDSGTADDPPDCSVEEQAVTEIKESIQIVKTLTELLSAAQDGYTPAMSQLLSAVETIAEAGVFLRERQAALVKLNTPEVGVPGAGASTGSSSQPSFSPRPGSNMPVEKREGNVGGPERG